MLALSFFVILKTFNAYTAESLGNNNHIFGVGIHYQKYIALKFRKVALWL